MSGINPAKQAAETLVQISHLPASMNGSPVLYCLALTSVMCIAALGGTVAFWMGKEALLDRGNGVSKNTVLFNFRLMMGMAGAAAFIRSIIEVFYLQMYGDPRVSLVAQAAITTAKRVADSVAVGFVAGWVCLLVMIYPYIEAALQYRGDDDVLRHLTVDDYPSIKRLRRPALVFVIFLLISIVFTFSKVYGG